MPYDMWYHSIIIKAKIKTWNNLGFYSDYTYNESFMKPPSLQGQKKQSLDI